ncbi:hypothetical protein V1477_011904 [Vespula maculifrons]|uniref:Uncharacterized protein n=1 Tax=Vespula maculifrons TaxID=7453 RepID=A0ABD2C0J8_VESMC
MDLRLGQLNRLEEGWLTKRFYEQEMSSPRFSKSQFSARSEKVQTSQGPMVPLEKFTSELVKNPIFTSSSKRKEGIRKKKKKEEVEQESLFLFAMLRKRETCSRVSSNFPFSFLPTSLPPSSLDSPMEEGRRRTVSNSRTRTYLAPSRDRDSLLRPPSRSASYANPSSWVGHMPSMRHQTAVSVEATPPTQRVSFPMKQTAGHYFSSMSTISLRLRPTRNYVIAGVKCRQLTNEQRRLKSLGFIHYFRNTIKNAPTRFERTRDFKCGSGSYKNRVMTGVPSPESS